MQTSQVLPRPLPGTKPARRPSPSRTSAPGERGAPARHLVLAVGAGRPARPGEEARAPSGGAPERGAPAATRSWRG